MAGVDSFSPGEIARLVQTRGVAKAGASVLTTSVVGGVGGAFIALGAVCSTVVRQALDLVTDPPTWNSWSGNTP